MDIRCSRAQVWEEQILISYSLHNVHHTDIPKVKFDHILLFFCILQKLSWKMSHKLIVIVK